MKKTLFYFIIFIFLSVPDISAQFTRFGFTGGINKTGLFGIDKPDSFEKQTGYFAGVYLDNRIGEYLSVQSEINVSKHHFNFSEPVIMLDNSTLSVDEKDYFISVPVFLKYKRGYEFIFWDIGLGGQVSVLAETKRELSLKIGNYETDPTYYYNYENNWYEYGFIGNAGIQFKAVNIFIRYYISMRNIYKSTQGRDMSFNILTTGASYQFNYKEMYPYGRKTGWKGLKYKITHLFK